MLLIQIKNIHIGYIFLFLVITILFYSSFHHINQPTSCKSTKTKSNQLPPFSAQRFDTNIISEINRQAFKQAQKARSQALLPSSAGWELVGPTNIGGRITTIAVNSKNINTLYIGSATGGVFKSVNAGQSWQSIFDQQASLSIGALALAPSDTNVLYVGTGETNAGGGSLTYGGTGVFKSENGGTTWQGLGLEKTRHIGRILVHPQNPQHLFVAAMGNLFSHNAERGVFRSKNGGDTWEKVLFVSEKTGCIDLVMHPHNPQILYAAMWQRIRHVDRRDYGGNECGIYQSKDGGSTWKKLTNGLPKRDLGRIGLTIAPSNPNVVYAIYADATGYYKGIYKTTNGGEKWKKLKTNYLEEGYFYESYGWWFGQIRVHPQQENIVYALGIDLFKSGDGGKNWLNSSHRSVHVDQHDLYIHPQNPNFLLLGNDGGLYVSKNAGETWQHINNLPITQFYSFTIHPHFPEKIYGGTQDNGLIYTGSSNQKDWKVLTEGDAFDCLVDFKDTDYIYTTMQYGSILRATDGGSFFNELPTNLTNEDRKNWHVPMVMHPLYANVLYIGTNRMYRSVNRGNSWQAVSPDLTNKVFNNKLKNKIKNYHTITSIAVGHAEPQANVIYVGTDDGRVSVTFDGGCTWKDISQDLPKRWVTSISLHPKQPQTAYITFSGYCHNENEAHVYVTKNGGMSWENIGQYLPNTPVNQLIINHKNLSILYLATDLGVFMQAGEQKKWQMLGKNLPNVPVTHLQLQTQNNCQTLFAATYGRSIFKMVLN